MDVDENQHLYNTIFRKRLYPPLVLGQGSRPSEGTVPRPPDLSRCVSRPPGLVSLPASRQPLSAGVSGSLRGGVVDSVSLWPACRILELCAADRGLVALVRCLRVDVLGPRFLHRLYATCAASAGGDNGSCAPLNTRPFGGAAHRPSSKDTLATPPLCSLPACESKRREAQPEQKERSSWTDWNRKRGAGGLGWTDIDVKFEEIFTLDSLHS